ncbi:MAG TPA: amidophosphoribosyltransferase [Candidatus Polarisedimenticolia bacterium]|nr:amidophosphoribosyltransferase [Candidatus Polarisedimenticolia bacterium]
MSSSGLLDIRRSDDRFHDECGIFGILGHAEAGNIVYLGLHALQHRGQESAGIATSDGERLHLEVGMGQVGDIFDSERLARLPGGSGIGHVRYSTAGSSDIKNAQPMKARCHKGEIAVAHNGNLVNADRLRSNLECDGSIFTSTSDTEVVLHLIARSHQREIEDAIVDALSQVKGAYSLVFLSRDRMVGVRDPMGFRPLSLGMLDGAYVLTSETTALDLVGARFVRDVEAGEVVVIEGDEVRSYRPFPPAEPHACVFEYVYFARPDSLLWGRNVSRVRKRLGLELAREAPADADIVVPIPDSGVYAAMGYAAESGIPYDHGLVRSHYIGRTFIEPTQSIRHFGVRLKLNPVREVLEGKRVVLVDDSIVRGTTSRKLVTMVREAGAKEVHMRISCPPTIGPCYYGVDTPLRSELIAATHSVEEIRKHVRADSLAYLSLEGMMRAVGASEGFCTACYTNKYPIEFPREKVLQIGLFDKAR